MWGEAVGWADKNEHSYLSKSDMNLALFQFSVEFLRFVRFYSVWMQNKNLTKRQTNKTDFNFVYVPTYMEIYKL